MPGKWAVNLGAEGKQLIEMHFASLGIYSRTGTGLSLQGAGEGRGGQRMQDLS